MTNYDLPDMPENLRLYGLSDEDCKTCYMFVVRMLNNDYTPLNIARAVLIAGMRMEGFIELYERVEH